MATLTIGSVSTQRNPQRAVAALFVERGGVYWGLSGVDPWDECRDARLYNGPLPIVAHPPCQRWGKYWHGSPRKPHQYQLGDDRGCFASALNSLNKFGGVLEHPAYSRAWEWFGIIRPDYYGGWVNVGRNLWSCHVEQGHYGHIARKTTWLLYKGEISPPELIWGPSKQRLPQYAIERYGYKKARRIGVMAAIGGKNKTVDRNRTPEPFRDLLISLARGSVP